MPSEPGSGFAVWLTGLPASGKSTIARELVRQLAARGVRPRVLESDAVRREITPGATYGISERAMFYASLSFAARVLTEHGVPVIVDATANRRAYRDRSRREIPRVVEVYVRCPLAVCRLRDPKGIYRRGAKGLAPNVPGLSAPYERPLRPEVTVDGDSASPEESA
ncbi:MAG: adenylyl-sulfate kinase, partial [Verrucomicrobiota bacterium]